MSSRLPFPVSLRVRVMLGVIVPLALILTIAMSVQFTRQRDLMLDNLKQFSVSFGDGIETSLAQTMLNRNRAQMQQIVTDLAARDSIDSVMILDSQGVVRIASRPGDIAIRFPLAEFGDVSRSFIFNNPDGSTVFRTLTPIPNQAGCHICHGAAARFNGYLVTDLPYQPVAAQLQANQFQDILIAVSAIVLVAGSILFLVNQLVLNKLQNFRQALTRFGQGDFSARVIVSENDEIGDLAHTVNDMAAGLADKAILEEQVERESARLRALYRVALESSRSLDVQHVMQAGLESARAVMHMDAGEIHLLDRPSQQMSLRTFVGLPVEFVQQENLIRCGECLCGGVVARGQISVQSELRGAAKVTRRACLQHGFHALAAVPLIARGQALGVLALHNRAAREFSSDDIALLNALGDQLGIAIENSSLYAEMEGRVQDLSQRVQHLAVSEERVRLAREMHDGFAQALSVLHLKLELARRAYAEGSSIAPALTEMRQIMNEAYEDVRQAISDLHTPLSDDNKIASPLAEYVQNFALRYELEAHIQLEPAAEAARCSPEVGIQAIRIVQGALANVRKHAHARQLHMNVARLDGHLQIELGDDGQGFDPAQEIEAGHFGLDIMRERATGIGGALRVASQPNAGTTITLTVPVIE